MFTATKVSDKERRILIKAKVESERQHGIRVYLPGTAISVSDPKEFISNGRYEETVGQRPPARRFFDDLLSKADFVRTFQMVAGLIQARDGHTVLELGASHCWASVLVKCDCPGAYVVASDLVPGCVRHAREFENAPGMSPDEKWAFSVRDIPFADAQFDRVFTFAASHHFGDHGDYLQAMGEIARILKPGGKLVLLYEPTSPRLFYRSAYGRVNRKRSQDGVDEDVLVLRRLRRTAEGIGLTLKACPFPIFRYRESVASTMYYYLLAKLGIAKMMVCTANITIEKHR
jgi:SAM-dependent methyltransferase